MTPMFTHIYIYLDFILFVCSWNNYSLPQLRLYQCAVYVEGSSAVALDPAKSLGLHCTSYKEREGERDPQSQTTNSPQEG